jgi:hypothetical protein
MLPEVRMARVLDAIRPHHAKRLRCVEAGERLSMSERHCRRWRNAYEERGEEGLERFPITWNHVIGKRSNSKSWSISLSKKSSNFFGTCSN